MEDITELVGGLFFHGDLLSDPSIFVINGFADGVDTLSDDCFQPG